MAYGHTDTQAETRFRNELGKNTRDTVVKLCAIETALAKNSNNNSSIVAGPTTGVDCDGNSLNLSGVQTIPHPSAVQLVKICPSSSRDPEVVCISNDGGTTVVSGWEVFSISSTGVVTSDIYYNGVNVTGGYSVVPCGDKSWQLLEVELVDDVAGNGTGAIIPYTELYNVSSTGVRILIATVDEKGADYILVGTRRNPNEIGTVAKTAINQIVLNGSTWSPTDTIANFSYAVIKIADVNNPPTFIGTDNISVPLFSGETVEYSVIDGTKSFDVSNVQITANSGDIIKIVITKLI